MQISRPVIQEQLQSVPVPAVGAPDSGLMQALASARRALRWMFDVDDGGGAITCFVCMVAVFGLLVVRLEQLDHALDSQQLKCTQIDKNSLQMRCEFE